MNVAYIQLKNGYSTLLPCDFMTEENGIKPVGRTRKGWDFPFRPSGDVCYHREAQGGK